MELKRIILVIGLALFTIAAFSQIDSLENKKLYSWQLNQYDFSKEYVEIDTSLRSFQNYNVLLEKTILPNNLGNLGSAVQSRIYFDREKYRSEFLFSEPYGIYFKLPSNQNYYNTKRQFTVLNYSNAGPKEESEQVLGVLHTQNVNENFNFGLDYDMISSDGRYQNQQVRQNKINLFSSYTNKRYQIHTSFNLNRQKAQENGGIDSLSYLGSSVYSDRKNIPVKLNEASTQIYNTNFYLVQEYNIRKKVQEIKEVKLTGAANLDSLSDSGNKLNLSAGSNVRRKKSMNSDSLYTENHFNFNNLSDSIRIDTIQVLKISGLSLSHELFYNSDIRKFTDNDITDGSDNIDNFYTERDIFIDSTKTREDVRQSQFGNSFALHYKKDDKFSSKISVHNEQVRYEFSDTIHERNSSGIKDSIVRKDKYKVNSNNSVSLLLNAKLNTRFSVKGLGIYFISGYKKENSLVKLDATYSLFKNVDVILKGKYENTRPDYYYEHYTSNNFIWRNNNLGRIEEWGSEFLVKYKRINLHAGIRYGQITNYVFLNNEVEVNQHVGQINILSANLTEVLKFGPVNSLTRFVYQKSSKDSILSLPEINLYQSLYFERLSKFKSTDGELLWQFGIDYRYSSAYYADGYMPISGLFYRQYDQKLLDHHCLDIFVNFMIKKARIYLKYSYLNSVISDSYFYSGPYYPSPQPVFKFGLAWTFYD
jgi:Putative porin